MFVSYLSERRIPHPQRRRVGTYTNRMYFDTFQVDGRAILSWAGGDRWKDEREPLTWLADVDGQLWLCSRDANAARAVQGSGKVPASAIYDTGSFRVIH